jgi:hypothetical protein
METLVSTYKSIMFCNIRRNEKMWSVVDLLRRNPRRWLPIILYINGRNDAKRISNKILYEFDKREITAAVLPPVPQI